MYLPKYDEDLEKLGFPKGIHFKSIEYPPSKAYENNISISVELDRNYSLTPE